ncbi:inhibitor of prohead protease [Acinetobacter phage vB_AbaM_PhT2]|uniref:Inhibitor of prohead protease n=1 Tax=Acinetobacter phage vB_AbaM_PhT2 TaxID=2690230 RepID=A0A6B9SYV5_9CAUD|nr:minor head protein inhibitor of protease [Acinetobacter phage vB_AbaM_PhT2]QHJ75758.1 inhibitor of prohead protease [Acinetobacter phage vB_AbaM_PhT2]
MLDHEYIKELQEISLEDKRLAKEKLAEYAETFGIKIKKTKSFDSIVNDIKAGLTELAGEPLPDQNEGLTISDLITAADSNDGKVVFEEVKEQAQKLLVDSPVVEDFKILDIRTETDELGEKLVADVVIKPTHPVQEIKFNAEIPVHQDLDNSVVEEPALYTLPENYSPGMHMLGNGPNTYVTLPWWIYEWITQHPEWKQKPNSFPHAYGIDTLYSLIYYIKRDGYVRIRETRNSSFVILE